LAKREIRTKRQIRIKRQNMEGGDEIEDPVEDVAHQYSQPMTKLFDVIVDTYVDNAKLNKLVAALSEENTDLKKQVARLKREKGVGNFIRKEKDEEIAALKAKVANAELLWKKDEEIDEPEKDEEIAELEKKKDRKYHIGTHFVMNDKNAERTVCEHCGLEYASHRKKEHQNTKNCLTAQRKGRPPSQSTDHARKVKCLAKSMQDRGMSQKDVAAETGISQSYLSQWKHHGHHEKVVECALQKHKFLDGGSKDDDENEAMKSKVAELDEMIRIASRERRQKALYDDLD
jgi:predicted transcriptional regulator